MNIETLNDIIAQNRLDIALIFLKSSVLGAALIVIGYALSSADWDALKR